MADPTPPQPRPAPKALVAERVASHRDPLSRLRARGFGGDVVRRRPPVLELYYEPGDPHSHLCAQLLPRLVDRLRCPIEIRLVGESAPEDYPERDRQRAYAILDATRIAPAHGLTFPGGARLPDAAARRRAGAELAAATDVRAFVARERELATALFSATASDPAAASCPAAASGPGASGDLAALLEANARRRHQLGHNLPGLWQFDGDWFWGIDRLDHLEARLRRHKLLDGSAPLDALNPAGAALPGFDGPVPRLEFFYSFRSPYSYLATLEMQRFHRDWPAGVDVRPVLPMAMRNISVPRVKRMYTVRDVKREADRLGVPFGKIADPIGDGARRCLQVFPLAEGTEQQLALLVSASRGVWSEGIDVATDEGLRYVVERAGLSWPDATALIAGGAPESEYAERNRLDLLESGLWGVPCYRIGTFGAWGQDRFWMLREILRRHTVST
jgi:2-hydroxychromene-2-carboxylate isomerase